MLHLMYLHSRLWQYLLCGYLNSLMTFVLPIVIFICTLRSSLVSLFLDIWFVYGHLNYLKTFDFYMWTFDLENLCSRVLRCCIWYLYRYRSWSTPLREYSKKIGKVSAAQVFKCRIWTLFFFFLLFFSPLKQGSQKQSFAKVCVSEAEF